MIDFKWMLNILGLWWYLRKRWEIFQCYLCLWWWCTYCHLWHLKSFFKELVVLDLLPLALFDGWGSWTISTHSFMPIIVFQCYFCLWWWCTYCHLWHLKSFFKELGGYGFFYLSLIFYGWGGRVFSHSFFHAYSCIQGYSCLWRWCSQSHR